MPARRLNERAFDAYMEWLDGLAAACKRDAADRRTGSKISWQEHYSRLAITYEMCRGQAASITDPPTKV